MARQPITIQITTEEYELVKKLRNKHITQVSIFRLGLSEIRKSLVVELTQNNNA